MKSLIFATAVVLVACGSQKHDDQTASPAPTGAADAEPSALLDVRVCKASNPLTGFGLLADVSYSSNLYPVMQRACASCHGGAIEDRQNSTNCFYLRDHAANVIKRLENAADAAARAAADPTLTDQQLRDAYADDEAPMPQIGGDREPLSGAEIDLFKRWAKQDDQCSEGGDSPDLAEIPTPEHYTSDADDQTSASFAKIFGSAACEDGPSVNTPESWALVEPLLATDPNPESAFYDYSEKLYVPGAEPVDFDCTWDGLLASLDELTGFEDKLREYESHGWRLIQCAKRNGLPLAGMVTLSRATNSIGDVTYGVNYKTITIDNADAATSDTQTDSGTATDTATATETSP